MKPRIILAIVMVIVIALVLFLIVNGDSKVSTCEIKDGNLKINGSFSVTVPVAEISALELKDTIPKIATKTNGSGLGSVCKGEFKFVDGRKARLYVDASKPPFISFTQGTTVFYINTETPGKTKELFDQLKAVVK
jgi:hypothetical protein